MCYINARAVHTPTPWRRRRRSILKMAPSCFVKLLIYTSPPALPFHLNDDGPLAASGFSCTRKCCWCIIEKKGNGKKIEKWLTFGTTAICLAAAGSCQMLDKITSYILSKAIFRPTVLLIKKFDLISVPG